MSADGMSGWPRGQSQMTVRIREFDWSTTDLGPIGSWPQSLKTAVEIMLGTAHMAEVSWGRDLTFLYNDAYVELLGTKHPYVLGRSFMEVWPQPQLVEACQRTLAGQSLHFEDQFFEVPERSARPQGWFTGAWNPLRDDEGAIRGIIGIGVETTRRVVAEGIIKRTQQHQTFLLKLSDALREIDDPFAVQIIASQLMAEHLEVECAAYAELDADGQYMTVSRDWCRSGVASMGGRYKVNHFGALLTELLHKGDVAVIRNASSDPRLNAQMYEASWMARLGVQAAIVYPVMKDGRFVAAFFIHQSTPRDWSKEDVSIVSEVSERTWHAVERARAEMALRAAEHRMTTLMEGIPQLVWRADGDGKWTWVSPQWTQYTGLSLSQSIGLGWLDALHPDDKDLALAHWREANALGELRIEARICDVADVTYRWFDTQAAPVRNAGGDITEWLGSSSDIEELHKLQERQEVLVGELQHRTRNIMAVVRSIAAMTASSSPTLQGFLERYDDRLQALARVQGLLSRLHDHHRVTFDELIRAELDAMRGVSSRIHLKGPKDVSLRSSMVQTLAMALHELATNAMKYGALSQPQAKLSVTWELEKPEDGNGEWLFIRWQESGVDMGGKRMGTAVIGQGRMLIEHALPYQLNAKTTYSQKDDGVCCEICIPVSQRRRL